MSDLSTDTLLHAVSVLLTEAYDGPPNPKETWFIDNEPDSGILSILDRVSAAEASTSVDGSGKQGTTIAANAEHLRWSLANANAALKGAQYNSRWKESWNTLQADEQAWTELRAALRAEFKSLREAVIRLESLPGPYLLGVLALIPHAAYHLGSIRQMVERVRAARASSEAA